MATLKPMFVTPYLLPISRDRIGQRRGPLLCRDSAAGKPGLSRHPHVYGAGMNDIERKGLKPFSANARENLGDARLLLDSAAHNAQVAARNLDQSEALEALNSALTMAEQALVALKRVRDSQG